jgi:hypothetical protein
MHAFRARIGGYLPGHRERLYFRGDAAFVNPEMYEFLDAEGIGYRLALPKAAEPWSLTSLRRS